MTGRDITRDVILADGRTLRAYDAGPDAGDLAVLWHHGTPGLGELPLPLNEVASEIGIRWFGYDRPGYGPSTRYEGRTVADAAGDAAHLAAAFGIDRFATLGASGGGPHALACAALLPGRVTAVVAIASLAPFEGSDDWFAGMYAGGEAELRAAVAGRDTLADHLAATDFDPAMFTAADMQALEGKWGWLGTVAGRALNSGLDGMVDDDLAFVQPWGFDPAAVAVPTLVLHGMDDRVVPPAHADVLHAALPDAEVRRVVGAGHLAVMNEVSDACRWLGNSARY